MKINNSKNTSNVYFRPLWTCGRYDRKKQVAIVYNLISGLNFLFEDVSASVIGYYLSKKRSECFSLEEVSDATNISINSLLPFINNLTSNGLVSTAPMTSQLVDSYRKEIHSLRVSGEENDLFRTNNGGQDTVEKLYAKLTGCNIFTVMLELTYNCSAQCIHCYNPGAVRNADEKSCRNVYKGLKLSDYTRIIDELYSEGLVKICLSGGDPFSFPQIWDLIDYLHNKEIAFEIYTNGINLVGKEKRLAEYFPCNVGVSIYSTEPEIHDEITQTKGSFDKSKEVLNNLSLLAVPLEIKCCVMKNNLKHYLDTAKFAEKLGAVFQLECAIFDSLDGDECVSKNLRLSDKQMEMVLRDKNNPLYVGQEVPKWGAIEMGKDENGCGAGAQNFCVTPNGNLVLCCNFHALLGNLRNQHLSDILQNNKTLQDWQSLSIEKYEDCWKHEYCKFCKFCPGLNFAENGTPLKASRANCQLAKIRFNLAAKLSKGEDPLQGMTLSEVLNAMPNTQNLNLHKIPTKSYFDIEL